MLPRLRVSNAPRPSDRSVRSRRLWLTAALGVLVGLLAEISALAVMCLSMSFADKPHANAEKSVAVTTAPTCCNNCGCSDSARSNGMCCCTGRVTTSPSTIEESKHDEPALPQVGCPCGKSSESILADTATVKTIFVDAISRRIENQSRCATAHSSVLPDITIRPETPPPQFALQIVPTFV